MTQSIDTLVINAHLFTMAGTGVGYIENGAVAISGQKIVAVGDSAEFTQKYTPKHTIDAAHCAVLPGLIDAHMHTSYSVVRGVAQDVWNWMQKGLAPYGKYMSTPEAANAGTALSTLEAVKAGTTTMGDYGWPQLGWPEIFDKLGVRARLTARINALPKAGMAGLKVGDLYPFDEEVGRKTTARAVQFAKDWDGAAENRITVMLGPQGPDMMGQEQFLEVKRQAASLGLMLHVHTAQGDREIDQMVKRYDMRTIDYMDEIGYLDDQLLAVHLTEATDEETIQVAQSGASMALCSASIGIIDGIVPPAVVFREAGGLVCLGSDQSSGNNMHNVFNEMRSTALFNKIKYRDPTKMPAWEVLRMATIEGAQAIGLGDQIGSLEVGKQADLILVDLKQPNLSPILQQPIRNIVPNLVYAGTGHEVTTVMVAGKVIVEDGVVLTVDEAQIVAEAQKQAEIVAAKVLADPVHADMALLANMEAGQL